MIHILPEHVANKIAAGEVVERPSSIVKELIENSLDANATRVDVHMEHGGKSLIRVADNGYGMSPRDAKIALQRHATSKIERADDLINIHSFGFRGEALPSIAAVSRMRLRTRARREATGTEIVVEGGSALSIEECSCHEGTIVEVRDLFFNVPARRKFMRSDGAERASIMNVTANFVMAMTGVHFSLTSGDREIWKFSPNESLTSRAQQVFGLPYPGDLLAFSDEENGVRVSGLVGKPQVSRANRSGQVFFVNRRMVKALPLSFAVQDACHGLLMQGQYPVAIVFVELDPEKVDVNVHPTKQEVRLLNEREIKSLLKRAVSVRLAQEDDMAPFLKPSFNSFAGAAQRDRLNDRQPHGIAPTVKGAWNLTDIPTLNKMDKVKDLGQPVSLRNKLHIKKILDQIHQTYIVAETDSGFILIDQHAAHERIMFEELLEGYRSGKPQKQGLLLDEVLTLRPAQEEILKENLNVLENLGFELDPFGENEYVIRAVPATLYDADPAQSLKRFLEQKESGKIVTDLEKNPENVAALIACKQRSVKAHDAMTPQAMQSLLERLAECDNPFNCPHGRPTLFKMTLDELEKQFKRKG